MNNKTNKTNKSYMSYKTCKNNKKCNKIYSILLILTLIIFTINLVACDNGIITTKNNNLAYTEVLEAKGFFIYNNKKYNSLSEVIKEIKEKGIVSEQTIKIDGNVISRKLVISPDVNINIDLNGNEMKFIDVIDSAIRIEEGASLSLSSGSLTLTNQKNQDLTVISAENANSLDLSDLVINSTDKQTNLDINKVNQTTLSESVVIKGPVNISGGKENTHVSVSNRLPDVRMNGGSLTIEGHGGATISENNGDNSYAESPHGTIVDLTGSIDSDSVADALYYIDRTPVKSYFGSLEKAITDLKDGENEIILIDDDNNSSTANTVSLNVSIILNLRGYILSNYNFNLCGDSTLTIKGTETSEFSGNIVSDGGTSNLTITSSEDASKGPTMKGLIDVLGTVNADSVTFKSNIEADGDINLDNCIFDADFTPPDLKSNNANVNLTDAEGSLGDITAYNGDVSINNSDTDNGLSVKGVASPAGDISLTGNSNWNINVNGEVKGDKIKTEDTNLKGNVDATTSFEADGCSIGDNYGDDHVYSPSIDIINSDLNNVDLGGGKENNVITPADNVKITNPSTDSNVGKLRTGKLNVNDTNNNLTVADTILNTDNNNSINGGNYGEFTFTGTGNLNITDGNFDEEFNFNGSGVLNVSDGEFNDQFNHNGSGHMNVSGGNFNNTFNHTGSGPRSFTAGIFTVTGSNSNNNLSEIDTISSYVGQNGSITIVYYPSDLVYLSGNYSFGSQLTTEKTAKIIFKDEYDEDSKLTKGVAVNNNQTASLSFSSGITQVEGSLFVKLGGTLNSSKDIGIKENNGTVSKLKNDGKGNLSVNKTGSNPYVFKAEVDVTLRAVGNEGSIKHDVAWSCDYNTNVSLPLASTLGSDFDTDTQKVDGWSTSASSDRTKSYDDGGTVSFTEDCELYAVWKSKIIPSGLVEVPSKHAIVASCMLFDEDGNDLQSVPNGGTSERWKNETYFYLNTTDNTVKVRGVYNPPEVGHKEEYTIIAENTVINREMNSPYFMGLEVIKAIGDMNHPSGNLDYYFFDKGPYKAYKYSRQSSTWDSSVTEISSFDDAKLTVRITIGTLPTFPDP